MAAAKRIDWLEDELAESEGSPRGFLTPLIIVALAAVVVGMVLLRSSVEDEATIQPQASTEEAGASARDAAPAAPAADEPVAVSPAESPPAHPEEDVATSSESGEQPVVDERASAGSPFTDPETYGEVPEEILRAFEETATAEIPEEILEAIERMMDPPPEHVRQEYEMIGRREVPPDLREQFENPYPELPEEVRRSLTVDTTKGRGGQAE